MNDYVFTVFNGGDLHNKPVTICPKCLMEIVRKYTNLKWDFRTFLKHYARSIRRINENGFSIDEYVSSKFYLTIKQVMERVDNTVYANDIQTEAMWIKDSEYYFLNTTIDKSNALPRRWLDYECVEWKKNHGGPDFKFVNNIDESLGLELIEISHNFCEIPEKTTNSGCYIEGWSKKVKIKEGYFENYLLRCIDIVKDKTNKSIGYDKTDALYLGIIGTQSMVIWHHCFLEIILNNLNFETPFKRIFIF